ncbi:hypothetical protein [Actinoplanes sp. G11-F43]|uniref:hypothetical protein n=1 Tax=Actinoplanes sp. G11-F43 TaxID=3424130 RepID=UPI003D32583A
MDIDIALTSGLISAGGLGHLVQQTGVNRPDYLVISESSRAPNRFSIDLLECKGTKTKPYAYRQLAHAAQQLGSVTVDGRIPDGLAVSTVLSQTSVSYLAVQHRNDGSGPEPATESLPELITEPVTVDIYEADISESNDVDLDQQPDSVDPTLLTTTALRGSWAALADFAGNDVAFQRWAPRVMQARLGRTAASRPERITETIDNDLTVVGVPNTISLPGGLLQVILGVEAGVDEALNSGSAGAVLEAQRNLRRRELRFRRTDARTGSVISMTDEGSSLVLIPR